MFARVFCVYLMSGYNRRLYVGMTNDLFRRVQEHKNQTTKGFTQRYKLTQLVYYEECENARDAIAREKQIKRWDREKKLQLIESRNPGWQDLAAHISNLPRD